MFDEEDKKLAQGGTPQGAPVEDMFSSVDGGVPANLPFAPSAASPAPAAMEQSLAPVPSQAPVSTQMPAASQMDVSVMQRGNMPPPPDDILSPQSSGRRSHGGAGRVFGIVFIVIISIALVAGAVYLGLQYMAQQKVADLEQEVPVIIPPAEIPAPTPEPVPEPEPEPIPEPTPALPPVESPDTDGDGLTDAEENQLGTDPSLTDSDADGLSDQEEVRVYGTDPLNQDTDGDTYVDGVEVVNGFNPNGAGRLFQPLPPRAEPKQ